MKPSILEDLLIMYNKLKVFERRGRIKYYNQITDIINTHDNEDLFYDKTEQTEPETKKILLLYISHNLRV